MQRVVITGMGIVSCLGNNQQEVLESLKTGKSGIRTDQSHVDKQFRSQISGVPQIDLDALIDRKLKRFMGDGAAYAYLSMKEAIAQSGLSEDQVSSLRTGLIVGAGGHSPRNEYEAVKTLEERGLRRVGPYMVPRVMASSISANLATAFQIKGLSYSISSACATSAHCIGNAVEQIQLGKADVMFAGGGEECFWSFSMMFDAMGALSTKYNETPEKASRAYDKNRDGFVIAGGGGIVVLESLEHALKRGATIIAEVVGYGATSDGADMVAPSGEGAVRAMQMALASTKAPVDYINTHGTSTPVGDVAELGAIRQVFGKEVPPISSTKSLSGHSLGAAGVQEAIYCLLMLQNDFICASANIEEIDPVAADLPIVRETRRDVKLNTVLSNSFGFGGTNATLVMQRYTK